MAFIQHPQVKVCLLHGQAGSGKSLFGRCVEKRLWEEYEKGGIFPIVINLPSLADPTHSAVEQALSDYGWSPAEIKKLKNEHGLPSAKKKTQTSKGGGVTTGKRKSAILTEDISSSSSSSSYKLPRLVIILDGYDEIRTRENVYKSNHLMDWDAKVIISVRTEYLERLGDYSSMFSSGGKHDSTVEIFIQSFTTAQVHTYLSNIARLKKSLNTSGGGGKVWTFEDYKESLDSISGISDLIQHPFILQIVAEVLPALKKLQDNSVMELEVTRALVYEMFTDLYFDRAVAKLKVTNLPEGMNLKESFRHMSQDIACFMYEHGTVTVKGPSPNYSRFEIRADEGAKFFSDDLKTMYSRQGVPWKVAGRRHIRTHTQILPSHVNI
jgi:hypothetical protein